ncbi:MAG TPA: hypothetical protein VFL94_09400 [Actinomycetales bacterium]|nr:hypothetical protein [Actinomycetales bacterium]
MRTEWHVREEHLAEYASGGCDPVVEASTEAHLMRCDHCRAALGQHLDRSETERRWRRLADVVDQPSRTSTERWGRRRTGSATGLGVVRSAFGTPSLLWAGAVAVLVAAALPVVAASVHQTRGLVLLLALAPLVPMAAVSVAYRHASDPVGEIVLSTPAAGLRLVAMRAVAVGAAAVPAGLLSGWLAGLAPSVTVAWLLPGVALASLVMASGTTRLDPVTVAVVLGLLWAVAVGAPASLHAAAAARLVDLVSAPGTQLAALAVGGAAVLATVARRDAVAYRRAA